MDDYCGLIQNIIKVDYRSFFIYLFEVKWFLDVIERGPGTSIKTHINGFITIDSTKFWGNKTGTFILPQHCDQVCVSKYVLSCFKLNIILINFI